MDQRSLDGRPDVIRFVGEPLAEPLEISLGAARLVLHASSDALDTDWHVEALDVARPERPGDQRRNGIAGRGGATASTPRSSSGPARSSNTRSASPSPASA